MGQRDLKSGDTNEHRHANKQRHWPKNQKGETQQSQNGVGSANSYFTRGTSEVSNCPQSHTGLTNPLSTLSSGYCWVGWSTAGSLAQPSMALPSTQWHEKIQAQWLQSLYFPWLKVARHLYVTQQSNFHPFRQHLQGLSKSHINAKRMKQTRIEGQGLWKLSGHWNYSLRR